MSLPTYATFRDKDNKVLAYGFCNPGWMFNPSQYIRLAQTALANARMESYILRGGEYDERMFKTQEHYDTVKEHTSKGKSLEELQEEHGEQYFSENWHNKWYEVEIFNLRVLRSDLIKATKDPLYEEEFMVNLRLRQKQLDEMYRRKQELSKKK